MATIPQRPPSKVEDHRLSDEQFKLFELLRTLIKNPFINGRMLDQEPTSASDPSTPSRGSGEPPFPEFIKIPGNSSRNIPHGLGRKARFVMLLDVRGGAPVVDERDSLPKELADTHIRLKNNSLSHAYVAVWVA
jgi:hypothetical protein